MYEFIQAGLFLVYLIAATMGLLLRIISLAWLLSVFRKHKSDEPNERFNELELPIQVVQLPVYNEDPAMVSSLIDSACLLEYPKELLWIQILDDSDVPAISDQLRAHVAECRSANPALNLRYSHRPDRAGYKAGNLNHGLQALREEPEIGEDADPNTIMVSIFDADFIIPSGFLFDTVHHFSSPDVGAVQIGLRYVNGGESLLTRTQAAFLINLHSIDFAARSWSGNLSTYRGSAACWRLSAIESAGGWRGITQTEDVDLSIAAQLAGWRIIFLENKSAWCRLPSSHNGYRLQQRSWMKGIMEVFKLHARAILGSNRLGVVQKLMGLELFLLLAMQPLFMVVQHICVIPAYRFLADYGASRWIGYTSVLLAVLFNITHLPYLRRSIANAQHGNAKKPRESLPRSFWQAIYSTILGLGMFATSTCGLVQGLLGQKVYRDRTQKSRMPQETVSHAVTFDNRPLKPILAFEAILAIYSLALTGWALLNNEWGILLLYATFSISYPWILLQSLLELRKMHRSERAFVQRDE